MSVGAGDVDVCGFVDEEVDAFFVADFFKASDVKWGADGFVFEAPVAHVGDGA